MTEKPVPIIVRLYKSQRKTIARIAKRSKVSRAAVVRFAIDEMLVEGIESLEKKLDLQNA